MNFSATDPGSCLQRQNLESLTLIARIYLLALLTGKPISTWYELGQTRGSVFGGLAGSMEESRAECTVLWLAAEKELLKIFGCRDGGGDEGFEESEWAHPRREWRC
jgi:hypothetical protein